MKQELKIGSVVKVTTDNGDFGRYAIVLNHDGTPSYPNDYWIEFIDGDKRRAPYGDYELEVQSEETLQARLEEFTALLALVRQNIQGGK